MKTFLTHPFVFTIVVSGLLVACKNKSTDYSVASVDTGTVKDKEMCGTVVQKSESIFLQSVEGKSQINSDYLLEPQDGATTQVLQDLALRAGNACITAQFLTTNDAVLVKTVASIRETY